MDADARRSLETELLKNGLAALAGLENGVSDFVGVIAGIVNNWQTSFNRHGEFMDRHVFLRDLLAECDPSERRNMYDVITPKLNFPVKPLIDYEAMMQHRVEMLTSKRAMRVEGPAPHPIEVGGKKYAEAPASVATHAIATLHCQRCWKKKRFVADTPVGAMIAARKAGWKRMPDKETCPNCIKKLTESKRLVA